MGSHNPSIGMVETETNSSLDNEEAKQILYFCMRSLIMRIQAA